MIVNGDFEDSSAALPRGGAGSTIAIRKSTPELPAYGGTQYLEFNMALATGSASRSIAMLFPNVAGASGKTYRYSSTVRSQTGTLSPQCYVQFALGANIVMVSYLSGGTVWEEVSTYFRWNFGSAAATPVVTFNCPANKAYSFGIDNVQFVEVVDPPAIPEALPTPFRYVEYNMALFFSDCDHVLT
jgi:hypothetical protein